MVTRNEALEAVKAQLSAFGDVVVMDDATLEFDFGWVFFYDSAAFVQTNNFENSLIGNAPYLVERSTGELFVLGTAHAVEHYIAIYRQYGHPHFQPSRYFRLSGWTSGAVAVTAIKAVRTHTDMSLAHAKREIERVLDGETADFEASSVNAASVAVRDLEGCGFVAERLSDERVA